MTTADGPPEDAASSSLPTFCVIDQGGPGLRDARDRVASMSELTYRGASDEFRFSVTSFSLAPAVLLEACVPRLHYERSTRHVAAGDDRYLLVMYLRGENHLRIAGDEIAISAGDVGVIDLAFPSHSAIVPPRGERFARHVTLLLPRAQLAPLLAAPDAVGAQVIRGDTGYGRIVHGLLSELWRQTATLDLAQATRVTQAIAGLVAGALQPAPGREGEVFHAEIAARRAAIKRYLDQQADPANGAGIDVDVDAVCRRFGMSRASLYRMFEPDGGLMHYVRQQRLKRARDQLASPAHRHYRIIDIAAQHGFHTESGFTRAFRRQFGITPGAARATALDPSPPPSRPQPVRG